MSAAPKSRAETQARRELAVRVLQVEAGAISAIAERMNDEPTALCFERAVEMLLNCRGRVVLTGMGKSGLVARKIAATLSSTGTSAFFLHPAEAVHGDLGMVVPGDVALALSYSGATDELLRLVDWLKRFNIPLITMTGAPDSPLAAASDVVLDIGIAQEACPLGLAPTASTTAAMAMGDALALVLLECRGFNQEDFARLHPAGRLGKRLCRVEELMRTGDAVPIVSVSAPMPDVIYEMSRKGLGCTAVLDDGGKVAGIISDGDLRRLLERRRTEALALSASACMTRRPVTIARNALAGAALQIFEKRKITALLVVDAEGCLQGILHLHDLWPTKMV